VALTRVLNLYMSDFSLWKFSVRWGLAGVLLVGAAQPVCAQETEEASPRQRAGALTERADSLRRERQLGAARATYRRALDLYRRVDAPVEEANVTGELGVVHAYQHQNEQALALLREAIQQYRAVGDTSGAAKTLNNVAIVQRRQGAYTKALETYQWVLSMYDALGNRSDRAVVLNNLGLVHEDLGHYRTALQRYREALDVHRALQDQAGIATSLDNLGDVLQQQGQYEAALARFREALALYRELDRPSRVANALNGIGTIHWNRHQHAKALERYREVLQIYRDVGDRSGIAANLSNIGALYREQGEYEKALKTLQEALEMNRELGDRASVAITLSELGVLHRHQGAHDAARSLHKEALQIHRDLGRTADVATSLQRLGLVHIAEGRSAAADSVLCESIEITETLLQTASGEAQRDFLAKEVDRFHQLVTARVRAGEPAAAVRAFERGRSRVLAHRLAKERGMREAVGSLPSVDSLQDGIGPREAAVLYASTDTKGPLTALVVTRDAVRAHEISDSSFVEWVTTRFDDALDRLRRQKGALLTEARGLHDRDVLTNVIRLYHHDLSRAPQRQLISTARRENLSQALYDLLVQPLEEELEGMRELVIVPDGALAYLPFETLRDRRERHLVERWQVQYSQSLRVHRLLQQRESGASGSADRASLLALGGAVYEADTYAADTAAAGRAGALYAGVRSKKTGRASRADSLSPASVRARLDRSLDAEGRGTRSYRQLGYGPDRWRNLSGTLRETRALGQIAQSSTLLVGEDASERSIRDLSESGALDDYRALHFATHGFVVPQVPALSALVLSEVETLPSSERRRSPGTASRSTKRASAVDGYLNMQEIAQLDLDAEFVGLSACETGVGRLYRGSGSVSLAQAFLRAGARSVAVSLWSVYDASTSRFMQSVYRRAWDRETTWSAALSETKRAFIEGDYGERLRAPRFWAPFVYYGRDGH